MVTSITQVYSIDIAGSEAGGMTRFSGKKPFQHEIFSRHIDEIRNLLHALELRENSEGHENRPPVDIYETDGSLILEFELPGFRAEDISLTVNGTTLILEAYRPKEQAGSFVCLERGHGRYQHAIHLPCNFNICSLSAVYRRGVLRVTCPMITDLKVPIKEIRD
jgi:HSP20 family protein